MPCRRSAPLGAEGGFNEAEACLPRMRSGHAPDGLDKGGASMRPRHVCLGCIALISRSAAATASLQ